MTAVVECAGLTKRYGKARGIQDLTLAVEQGEVFGFLGPNGAGKSTTIRTLLDLQRPTAGSARLFGLDSRAGSLQIRARLGHLPGDFALEPGMTGGRALRLAATVRGITDLSRAHEIAERFETSLDRPFAQLSRGNKQKIGLVLALFHRPDLLVFDEPTSGLDPLMQAEFRALVAEEQARGATVILSSHELEEVQRTCERVAIVREGRLVTTEHVSAMREKASRHVTVRFAAGDAPTTQALARLEGVSDVETAGDEGRLIFRVRGDVDPVVKALAAHHVEDLEIARASLDELFLALYRDPGATP